MQLLNLFLINVGVQANVVNLLKRYILYLFLVRIMEIIGFM